MSGGMNPKDFDPVFYELNLLYKKGGEKVLNELKMTTDNHQKLRSELKAKLDKQLTEEREVSEAVSTRTTDRDTNSKRRSEQISKILTETDEEVRKAFGRHKERVEIMNRLMTGGLSVGDHMKSLQQLFGPELTSLREKQRQVIDDKTKHINDLNQELETTRRQIETKDKKLLEIETKETEDIKKSEIKDENNFKEAMDKEMKDFFSKTKQLFKKT